jgi:kynurenine 3-monooxygenase
MPNVKFFFNHKLVGANFVTNKAWFEDHSNQDAPQELEINFDLLIGADGAHSSARYHLMKYTRMDYTQEYIDTLWCEFTIDKKEVYDEENFDDKFKISPHHLHIWPGKEHMFIAIPSLVGLPKHRSRNLY